MSIHAVILKASLSEHSATKKAKNSSPHSLINGFAESRDDRDAQFIREVLQRAKDMSR